MGNIEYYYTQYKSKPTSIRDGLNDVGLFACPPSIGDRQVDVLIYFRQKVSQMLIEVKQFQGIIAHEYAHCMLHTCEAAHKLSKSLLLSQGHSSKGYTSPLSPDDLHACISALTSIGEADEQPGPSIALLPLAELHNHLLDALQEQEQPEEPVLLGCSSAGLDAYLTAIQISARKKLQVTLWHNVSTWIADLWAKKEKKEEKRFNPARRVKTLIRRLKAFIRCLDAQLTDIASQAPQQFVYIRRYISQETRQADDDSHLTHLRALWSNFVLFETTPGDATCLI